MCNRYPTLSETMTESDIEAALESAGYTLSDVIIDGAYVECLLEHEGFAATGTGLSLCAAVDDASSALHESIRRDAELEADEDED